MSIRSRRALSVLAASALTLVLASCSGDKPGGGGGDDLSWEDSPLSKALGYDGGEEFTQRDQEEAQAEMDEQNRKMEELVSSCMAEQGFDYIPNTNNGGTISYASEDEETDPIENARQNGYGMTTGWGPVTEGEGEGEVYVDPNAETYEGMSDSEKAAWDKALYGTPPEITEETDLDTMEWNWEESGCYGAAQHQVYEVDAAEGDGSGMMAVYEDPQWAELIEEMNNLYTEAPNDPAVKELNTKWSTCMSEAGFDFATSQEAMDSINNQINKIFEDHQAENPNDTEWTGPTEEDLAPIKEQEIKVAVADYTCQDELDFQNATMRIQFDIEQRFVDEHKAELEAFAAALEAAEQ